MGPREKYLTMMSPNRFRGVQRLFVFGQLRSQVQGQWCVFWPPFPGDSCLQSGSGLGQRPLENPLRKCRQNSYLFQAIGGRSQTFVLGR